jgi:hypothetical protein
MLVLCSPLRSNPTREAQLALWQIDWGKRVPYPLSPDGYYYWSSTYYLRREDFASDHDLIDRVYNIEQITTCTNVQMTWANVKHSPGRGGVVATLNGFLQHGLVPLGTGIWSIITIARWDLWSTTGRRTRKYIRMPLRESDMAGDMLSTSGMFAQQAKINTFLGVGPFRNAYGERLTVGRVSPFLHPWQLRHGTKRSHRPVIA